MIESTDVFDTRCVLFKNVYACMISAASLGLYKTALFSVTVISLFLCFTQFLSLSVCTLMYESVLHTSALAK